MKKFVPKIKIFSLISITVFVGCSEYGMNEKPDDPPGETGGDTFIVDTGPIDTGTPPNEECPSDDPLGFGASVNEECVHEAQFGTFNPIVEWYKPTFANDGDNNRVMSTPIVSNVSDDNGDGFIDENDTPDVVFVTYGESGYNTNGVLRAISGADGAEIWSTPGQGLQGTGGVAAGDIDGDGFVEFVSLTPDRAVAFEHDGTPKWTSDSLSGAIYGISDVCSISDMNGDGDPEIICGNGILNSAGRLIGKGTCGRGGSDGNVGTAAYAADIDGDGILEVVAGNALYEMDGTTIWCNGQPDGYTAVADFDGDGKGDIVVSAGGSVRLQDHDGNVTWQVTIPNGNGGGYGGPPTVADFDGDGEPEVGVASGSRYSVIETDGSIKWQAVTDDSSSGNTGSAVFDFEGDGIAEVVYADQSTLWVFNGLDGTVKLASSEHSNGTWLEYPVVADVDGDGHAEIVVANTAHYQNYTGIRVFGDADNSWMPGRRTWNQHAYSITHVNDDGTIPAPVPSNWPNHNNFRSGDMTIAQGADAPDLRVGTGGYCEIDCEDDKVIFWVHIGNDGLADIEVEATITVELEAADGGLITYDTITVQPSLLSGLYQDSIRIVVPASQLLGKVAINFTAATDALECDETNNGLRIEGPFCQGP